MLNATPIEDFALLRVLVIDDQEHVRKWVRRVLKSLGITTVSDADDGQAALAAVTAPGAAFDLVLCDLKMPNTDGVELIRAFSSMGLETAVVLLSMEPERVLETSLLLAEEQGLRVLGALAKPLTAEKLEPLLRSCVLPSGASASPAHPIAPETLRNALRDGVLSMAYQPKIAMSTGQFSGVEALARWKHGGNTVETPGARTGGARCVCGHL
ncbi:MAG: response regulator [Gemmatimonadetes bacterium]|nr:response regulator [Gemmatimonadota bacterium]